MNLFRIALFGVFALLVLPLATPQQGLAGAAQSATDNSSLEKMSTTYSKEPYVIEKYATSIRFESDGTGERSLAARILIQNEAAAKQFSELSFGFNAKTEQSRVTFVRVRKSDGTAIDSGAGPITEETSRAAIDAPAYANAKEKRIAVPPLQPGDTLEYQVITRLAHPEAPGEFWAQHAFLKDAIVLDERLEISVPQGRSVKVRSPALAFSTDDTSSKTRIIYRWKRANLVLSPESNGDSWPSHVQGATLPDVQLTSFGNWDDVSRWYSKLALNATEPTPEIREKSAELIGNRATTLEKAQVIYAYVATKIRYVDVPLGTAGFAPHPAGEIFKNQYADAKDKHTLLAAMLQAAGLGANAALIPRSQKLDSAVPSPAQLDHAITAVPYDNGLIWMDSASEVAPFRFLPLPLRHKDCLLVATGGSGKIVETPADPPFPSVQKVDVEGQVSDLGKLTAHIHYQIRGDNELVLRLAFRRAPPSQWKDLGQTLLTLDGLHGDVTLAKSSDPLNTEEPFEVDLEYAQSNFIDWSSAKARVALPLLSIGLPDVPKDSAQPIVIGTPLTVLTNLKLSLAAGFAAGPPVEIAVARDYAEFKSSYRWTDGTLTAGRTLRFKMRLLPASRRSDYLAFTHAVEADQLQPLVVERSEGGKPVVSTEASPSELFEAGAAALAAGNAASAIPLLERLVALEPAHKEAWNNLGLANLRLANIDRAVAAFERQLQVNPADAHAHNYLGMAFEEQQKTDEAVDAFRKQIEIDPLDPIAHAALGKILLEQHRYSEAVPELDKATVVSPGRADVQSNLGEALINLGQNDKAVEAFKRAAEISPTPVIWSNAAYNLADHKVDLAAAQRFAGLAVSGAANELAKIDLQHLTAEQLRAVANIGTYWDTLGWVYFQKGDLNSAERYIRAAWLLEQRGEIADHLAQIHEKRGERDETVRSYAIALAAPHPSPETRARLTLVLGGNSQIDDLVNQARPGLIKLRTLPAGRLLNESVQADVVVLLAPGKAATHSPQVEGVRFLGGSEKLRPFADRLKTLDYGPAFPDNSTLHLIRRGTLDCSAATGECNFILLTPDEAIARTTVN